MNNVVIDINGEGSTYLKVLRIIIDSPQGLFSDQQKKASIALLHEFAIDSTKRLVLRDKPVEEMELMIDDPKQSSYILARCQASGIKAKEI